MAGDGAGAPFEVWACLWAFQVPAGVEADFLAHYGPAGTWAQLYGQDRGYLGTTLLRDSATPGRFLALDRWVSAEAYVRFRERCADAYEALNRLCEDFRRERAELGVFAVIGEGRRWSDRS